MQLVERDADLDAARRTVADPARVAVLAQTTLAQNEWAGVVERTRDRFPDVWTASRNDLCFATTNRQDALTDIAKRADAVVVIGSANSSNTIALTKVAREAGCPIVLRVDGPDELDAEVARAAPASSASPRARARPRSSSNRSSPGSRRVTASTRARHRRGRVLPAAAELRELIPALDAAAALLLGGDVTAVARAGGPLRRRPHRSTRRRCSPPSATDPSARGARAVAQLVASSNTTCNASCNRAVSASTCSRGTTPPTARGGLTIGSPTTIATRRKRGQLAVARRISSVPAMPDRHDRHPGPQREVRRARLQGWIFGPSGGCPRDTRSSTSPA